MHENGIMAPRNLDRMTTVYGPTTWDVYAELDESLDPAGPDELLDLAGSFLEPGDLVLDAGCRDGAHLIELTRRYDIRGVGVEPVERHVESACAAIAQHGLDDRLTVHRTPMHDVPLPDATVDLIWCRDVLEQLDDVPGALRECLRVAKPGMPIIAFTTVVTEQLTTDERSLLAGHLGNIQQNLDRPWLEQCFADAGLEVEHVRSIGTEWREFAEERHHVVSTALLRLTRLRRRHDDLAVRHGADIVEHVEANLHWELFQFLGKLDPVVFVMRTPDFGPASADRHR